MKVQNIEGFRRFLTTVRQWWKGYWRRRREYISGSNVLILFTSSSTHHVTNPLKYPQFITVAALLASSPANALSLDLFPGFLRVIHAPAPHNPEWTDALTRFHNLHDKALLIKVNEWANRVRYVDDLSNWGLPDYWETPDEFLVHGGDCEDFALTKYLMLEHLGVPVADMNILVGKNDHGINHAVLIVKLAGQALVLDSERPQIIRREDFKGFQPFYAVNDNGATWLNQRGIEAAIMVQQ